MYIKLSDWQKTQLDKGKISFPPKQVRATLEKEFKLACRQRKG